MPITQAASDFGFLPIVVIWAFLMIVGKIQKAKNTKPTRLQSSSSMPQATPKAMDDRQSGLMDELRNAMQELKAVETQATNQRRAIPAPPPRAPAPAPPSATAMRRSLPGYQPVPVDDAPAPAAARSSAFARLQEMKAGLGARGPGPAQNTDTLAPEPAPPTPVPGPLSRFADGTPRSAIILSEVLGRPRGESI